jgi:hypothetical protein
MSDVSGKRSATGLLVHSSRNTWRVTGLERSPIYMLIKAGRIRAIKVGRRTLIPADC